MKIKAPYCINNVIFNSKYILEPISTNLNSKRNTDSSIRVFNNEIINKEIINNEKINKSNKEKCNKVKAKINIDNFNSNHNINYSISSKNIKCVLHPAENLKKKILGSNSFKKNISSIPINNNTHNFNIKEILKKRKNIDINTEYQTNPSESIFNLENNKFVKNLNYTTTNKVKLKSNNFMNNIEFDKEKERLLFYKNNTIIKSRSKVKKLENKKDPELEIRIIDKKRNENIIFNNKRKLTNNSKVKNNGIYIKNLTEENPRDNFNKIELDKNNNLKVNNNVKLNKVKILPHQKEQINKNNTYKNNDSSFFTINFNNSNIDENNNNEFKPNLGKYNFVNNLHNNENTNNSNITKRINNTNDNESINDKKYNLKNKKSEMNVIKSNSNTNKNVVLENFPISCENKNIFKNLTSNNNFSNRNISNAGNNILKLNNLNNNINNDKNKNAKKDFELQIKKKIIEENNNKEEKDKEEIVLIELDEEKGPKDNYINLNNSEKKKDINFANKKFMDDLKEKDLSLDKSSSLRVLSVSPEEFIEKDDEVLKLLNSHSPRDNIPPKSNIINIFNNFNNYIQQNNEEESEIIIQNSEFSMMNDPSKYSYIINTGNKNIYQNYNYNGSNNNIKESKNIIDNITMKDTSIMSNYGIKCCKSITQAGKERTGHRKKNQDNYIIEKNLNNILGFNLFAILDGHGDNGHLVSQLASKYIIKKFTNITNKFIDTDNIEAIYEFFKKSDFQKIIDIFLEIDKEIIEQKKFDINLSGTTCVLVIQLGNHLICSNIGDSRAILIYDEDKIFELSHDSKPNVPEEKKRIELMGGVVDQVKDEDGEKTGPYRVYIKDKDQPGLAMSRSFGDKRAKTCGVIPYPDIIEFNLSNNNDCKYMVLCSDGVWEFISNEEVMEIGNKYYYKNNINEFCNELLRKSTEIWEDEENYMDDITIVVVFF